jgi:hypothetical protein
LKDEEKIVQDDFEGKEMTTRNKEFEKESQIYLGDKKNQIMVCLFISNSIKDVVLLKPKFA